MNRFGKVGTVVAVLGIALTMAAGVADARMGRIGNIGSRGVRTFDPPPVTRTAPQPAAPIERSVTRPGQAGNPAAGQRTPVAAPATRPGLFGGGFAGGLLGGLFAAGLFGALFGYGFFGGIAGLGSILGLILQIGIIFLLVRWALNAFRGRSRVAYAGAYPGSGSGPAPGRASAPPPAGPARTPRTSSRRDDRLGITNADQDAFEAALHAVQEAYGREDLEALRRHMTPEMASYAAEELADNASRGVINRLSDVKLLSGDVAESWREGDTDYATVAMQYAIRDEVLDRTTGRLVETGPSEVTEVWTFARRGAGPWRLSAIQQA